MSELAETACCRCREQKLRCSREQPKCARCTRLRAVCIFPSPPDRKKLASIRADTAKRKREQAEASGTGHDVDSSNYSSNGATRSPSNAHIGTEGSPTKTKVSNVMLDQAQSTGDTPIPESTITILIEIYFSSSFNAHFLFHRRQFDIDLANGIIPRHVILAICALATIYLTPTSFAYCRNSAALQPLGDLKAQGRSWALHAGKDLLPTVDQPDLDSVRSCQLLALFWFSQGEPQRNAMFSGIAYRAARALHLDDQRTNYTNATLQPENYDCPQWLLAETARRCMWATWMSNCVNADHYVVGGAADVRILAMPLPISEEAFDNKREETSNSLSNFGETLSTAGGTTVRPSLGAQVLKAMLTWAKIRDHIETRKALSTDRLLTDLFALDASLSNDMSSLGTSLEYSKRNLYEQLVMKQQPMYFLLHALYHQGRLVLHASLVPQFSGEPPLNSMPAGVIRLSAHTALKSAQLLSELSSDYLMLEWDAAQLAPFVGYCMYVAASVHLPFVRSPDARLRESAKRHLASSLELMRQMKQYWNNLEKLWTRIHILQGSQPNDQTTTYFDSAISQDDQVMKQIDQVNSNDAMLGKPPNLSGPQVRFSRLHEDFGTTDLPPHNQKEVSVHHEHQQSTSLPQMPVSTAESPGLASFISTHPDIVDLQNIYGSLVDPAQNYPESLSANQGVSGVGDVWHWDAHEGTGTILPWQDLFDTTNVT